MLGTLLHPSHTIRRAVILAAAVALILPLPARCVACSFGATDCTRCQVERSKIAPPAHRNCCTEHAAASHQATPITNCSPHVQSQTCGCNMQAPERTYVTVDRQIVAPELAATLPGVQPVPTIDAGQFTQIAAANENAPPPVPHRILHCSWII